MGARAAAGSVPVSERATDRAMPRTNETRRQSAGADRCRCAGGGGHDAGAAFMERRGGVGVTKLEKPHARGARGDRPAPAAISHIDAKADSASARWPEWRSRGGGLRTRPGDSHDSEAGTGLNWGDTARLRHAALRPRRLLSEYDVNRPQGSTRRRGVNAPALLGASRTPGAGPRRAPFPARGPAPASGPAPGRGARGRVPDRRWVSVRRSSHRRGAGRPSASPRASARADFRRVPAQSPRQMPSSRAARISSLSSGTNLVWRMASSIGRKTIDGGWNETKWPNFFSSTARTAAAP